MKQCFFAHCYRKIQTYCYSGTTNFFIFGVPEGKNKKTQATYEVLLGTVMILTEIFSYSRTTYELYFSNAINESLTATLIK